MPRSRIARAGLLAAFVLVPVACGEKPPPSPDHLFAPDGAGVIRETKGLATGVRVMLESGQTFDLGTGATREIESSTGGERGALLIYGEDNGQPWVSLWLPDTSEGSWHLVTSAWERPNDFVFLSGMVLPKSPEFRREGVGRGPSEDGFYVIASFVANERGEIVLACGSFVGN